jgi:hypothetical protein
LAVIDRGEGAIQNLASSGYQCLVLFRRSELGV